MPVWVSSGHQIQEVLFADNLKCWQFREFAVQNDNIYLLVSKQGKKKLFI